jgi:hypothetical protein
VCFARIVTYTIKLAQARQPRDRRGRAAGRPQVNDAVKLSFATSITRIYIYAFWLAIVALVAATLWLPEIPLGKSNCAEAPPVFE